MKYKRWQSARFKSALVLVMVIASSQSSVAVVQAKEIRCSKSQQIMVKQHISKQISALVKSDWKSAYSYAAKSFQDSIAEDQFRVIIESGYAFLIKNDTVTFGACKNSKTSFSQVVTIDAKGTKHRLTYGLTLVGKRLGIMAVSETVTPIEPVI